MKHKNMTMEIWGELDEDSRNYWFAKFMEVTGRYGAKCCITYCYSHGHSYAYLKYKWDGERSWREPFATELEEVPQL